MKVKVDIIFSRNKKIGSFIIRFATDHFNLFLHPTPSHVALLIENRWIFESTFKNGVRIIPFEHWKKENEICYKHYLGEYEYGQIKKLFRELLSKKYDWPGVLFLGICIILNKFFNTKLPKCNILESDQKYFCTEVIEKLLNTDLSMVSPSQLMNKLLDLKEKIV